MQVKHSYKVNELIRHKLELDELKVQWTGWYLNLLAILLPGSCKCIKFKEQFSKSKFSKI